MAQKLSSFAEGEEVVTNAEVSVDTDQTVRPAETITRADKAWNSHKTAKSAVYV